jgi:Alpha/beta hydrolase domain containing 18
MLAGLSRPLYDILFDYCSWLLGQWDNVILLLRLLGNSSPKYCSKGWGQEQLESSYREEDRLLRSLVHGGCEGATGEARDGMPATLPTLNDTMVEWGSARLEGKVSVREGQFESPLANFLPKESRNCRFYLVSPSADGRRSSRSRSISSRSNSSSVYIIMLPATGEMGKGERLDMARQLARDHGWNSIIVTAPFYGTRRPPSQYLFFQDTLGDHLMQSQAIVREADMLIRHCQSSSSSLIDDVGSRGRDDGRCRSNSKVVVTGFSWGGAMSCVSTAVALLAGADGRRLACVPYVGSASPNVVADGLLVNAFDLKALKVSQEALTAELGKTQLSTIVDALVEQNQNRIKAQEGRAIDSQAPSVVALPPTSRPAVVKMYSMKHDGFIRQKPHVELHVEAMKRLAGPSASSSTSFSMKVLPGGHIMAAVLRPIYQKRGIIEAVEELFKVE